MPNLSPLYFAMAQSGSGGGSVIEQLLPIFVVFGIFYFLLIRPQVKERKQHDQMLEALKKGDKVVTNGGLHGAIQGLNDKIIKLRIADKTTVQINRSAVATKLDKPNN